MAGGARPGPADGAVEARRPLRLAILHGSDVHRHMVYADDGEIFNRGNNDMWRLLKKANLPGVFYSKMLHLSPAYFRHRSFRWSFDDFDAIYNSISEADQNPKVLRIAKKVVDEAGLPVINRPERIALTTREKVAAALGTVPGILAPPTLRLPRPDPAVLARRMERAGLSFPVILRPAGTHTGVGAETCAGPDEAAARLAAMAGPVYATAFVDFRSADGLYRKYRFFVIGGRPVFRHLIVSDRWLVHQAEIERFMAGNDAFFAEEKAIYENGIDARFPGASALVAAAAAPFGLDYVGVDCGFLPDGRLVVFEVNATMNFLPLTKFDPFAVKHVCVPRAVEALRALVAEKTGRDVEATFGPAEARARLDAERARL